MLLKALNIYNLQATQLKKGETSAKETTAKNDKRKYDMKRILLS